MKRLVSLILTLMVLCMAIGAAASGYTPGSYSASAKGMCGPVKVTVEFSESRIESVTVEEHNETVGVGTNAIDRIPGKIVEYQSLGIDVVGGATITSEAILTAVAECVQQAGGDVEALKNVEVTKNGEDITLDADIVVVGAGASGCAAALKAAEKGYQVVLLEKQASAGGEAILSGGIIYAACSKAQAARGLTDDTPEALAEYWMSVEPDANYDLVLKIAEQSGSTIDWIESMGVEFDPVLKAQGLDKVDRGLTAANQQGGYGLMHPLIERINESANINLMLETRAERLIMNDGGSVSGVIAHKADGGMVTINTPAVIICTNSIDDSEELLAEYHPAFAKYASTGASTGDGHKMAREVGAEIIVIPGQFVGAVMPITGLQVNINGDRFTNEAGFYNVIWNDLLETTGSIENLHPILIIDSTTKENATVQMPMQDGKLYTWSDLVDKGFDPDFKFATAANGVSYKADTLKELAEMIGVPYEHLQASVDRYNELYEKGEDVDFGKDPKYLYKIENGPFYAYDEGLMVCYFSCGISVDLDMQVLRSDKSVIPGLYAAGFCAAEEFKPNQYPGSGAAISYSMNSGIIAAEAASSYLKK